MLLGNTNRRSNILKSSKRTGSLADPKRKSVGNVDSNNNNNNSIKSFRYFLVELIDPQVNFLDNKSHSSLIIVSGYYYLYNYFYKYHYHYHY